jgi:CubicO group peptidase (beta-lactamase class C family)
MRDSKPLPTHTPERVGIPSEAILRFLDRLRQHRLCMHSVMVLRSGCVALEAYWKPFDADTLHRLYSCSKSYVSVAVGILEGEGKLALDDRVVTFFPDKAPADLHPYIARTTIRDLLMMATPHLFGNVTYNRDAADWAATFFNTPPTHLPGKVFSYDTTATVMLTIIIERLAGMPFLEYLRPRLLDPMGCSPDSWCIQTPCGYSWGGSGVMATTRDFAKFALVCMNRGRYGDRQLIPEDYIVAATSRQIDNSVAEYQLEHTQGYGYQFWRTTHNGFACLGMGCQLAICLPDKDFILVTTADAQGDPTASAVIFDSLWSEIYPHLSGQALPENARANAKLQAATETLELTLAEGQTTSPVAARVSGRRFVVRTPGHLAIRWLRFVFQGDGGTMEYENETGRHELGFGFGRHHEQKFPETHYSGRKIGTPLGEGYPCYNSAAWVGEGALVIRSYLIGAHVGNLRISVAFEEGGARGARGTVTLLMNKAAEWFLDGFSGFVSAEEE